MSIPEQDLIHTLGGLGQASTRVKGSRFLALAAPAADREEAGKIVLAQEKKYHDARHHCWAWRAAGEAGPEAASHDDGEPSGTAGAPILQAIEGAGLTGTVVVVTRYFGGVKLGTGPLARAYAEAARCALDSAAKISGMLAEEFQLLFDYPLTGQVNRLLESAGAVVLARHFQERVGLNIAVPRSRAESFISALREATAARVDVVPLGARSVYQGAIS